MNGRDGIDEEIARRARERMQHDLPPDLVPGIMHEVRSTPQRGRGWGFWPTLGVGLAATAAGIGLAIAIGLARPTDVGDGPSPIPSPTTPAATSTAGPSPSSTVSTPTPAPTSVPSFGPLHSQDPEEAFAPPDACENPEGGYGVSMPDEWFYNTAFDGLAACQWFAPTMYQVTDASTVPPEVAIVFSVSSGGDFGPGGDVTREEAFTVAGRPAVRYEIIGVPGGFAPERSVVWIVGIGGELPSETATAPWLMASTGTDRGGTHEENVDVLDRMVATLVILD
jgi:hypothetical protein